jgi:hypothetical protein
MKKLTYFISVSLLLLHSFAQARQANHHNRKGYTVKFIEENYPIEYMGQVDTATFFVVHHSNDQVPSPESLKVKMGTENNLQDVKVLDIRTYRDGGTTEIKTQRGVFRFPTLWREDPQPTFNGKHIKVDPIGRGEYYSACGSSRIN